MIETYTPSLRDKMKALLSVFLDDSKLDGVTKKLVLSIANNFFQKATDEDIRSAVEKLRDDVIPFILEGQPTNKPVCDCMTYDMRGSHHHESCPLYENQDSQ